MTIVEFLHARVEDEYANTVRRWVGSGEQDEQAFMAEAWVGSLNEAAARFHERTMHLGVDLASLCPPFARAWASRYADHSDYDEAWQL